MSYVTSATSAARAAAERPRARDAARADAQLDPAQQGSVDDEHHPEHEHEHHAGADPDDVPWEPGTFYRRRYRPALAAADLPHGRGGVRFHDLRHTYASLCASAGVKSQQVAEWMGHANDTVTRLIYTHLFEQDTTAAVAALEALAGRRSASRAAVVRVRPRTPGESTGPF